jgi:D-alanyl-D-alanine carboxypeptidase/D-alanyl-D-alanine-endopeptidase (penicillin-binding protein 4)
MQTKRGKWLAFSFMHNNFTGRSASYYQEMETTLGWCYENL